MADKVSQEETNNREAGSSELLSGINATNKAKKIIQELRATHYSRNAGVNLIVSYYSTRGLLNKLSL